MQSKLLKYWLVTFISILVTTGCTEQLVPVKISSDISGAVIRINGEAKGLSPVVLYLPTGENVIDVTAFNKKIEKTVLVQFEEGRVQSFLLEFAKDIDISGDRVWWQKKISYKVPIEAGGGVLGFLVDSLSNGGVTESFYTHLRGKISNYSNGYATITTDHLEIGSGRYSYKGRDYRKEAEQMAMDSVGEEVEVILDDLNIESVDKLKRLIQSAETFQLCNQQTYLAAKLMILYNDLLMERGGDKYTEINTLATKHINSYKNMPTVDFKCKDMNIPDNILIVYKTILQSYLKSSSTSIPFVDWSDLSSFSDKLYNRELLHNIAERYDFYLAAQIDFLSKNKSKFSSVLTQMDFSTAQLLEKGVMIVNLNDKKVKVTFSLTNKVPKLIKLEWVN